MPIPYIGITDFTSFEQVEAMLAVFRRHLPPGGERQLHVGVMMSRKTLQGLPTKWATIFPPKERIAGIFGSDETLNCLHYADYENDTGLRQSLAEAISWGGLGIHALQLDMVWPDPAEVANVVHISRKSLEVILQIGERAFAQAGNDPIAIVDRLSEYEGVVHRVLLDRSMGRGLSMDADGLLPFACAIRERFPELGIEAAGGLGPGTVCLVKPLSTEIRDLSLDAQARLRPSGSAMDPVDWTMAEEYLIEAIDLLG